MVGLSLIVGLLYLQAGRINPAAKVASPPHFCFEGDPKKSQSIRPFVGFYEQSSFGRFGVELHPSLSLDHYDAINRDKDLTPNPEGLFPGSRNLF